MELAAAALLGTAGTATTAATGGLIGTAGAATLGGVLSTGLTLASAFGAMGAAESQAELQTLQAEGEALKGKQDELDIRNRLLEATSTINSQLAASGIAIEGAGTAERAEEAALKAGQRQVSTVRSGTAVRATTRRAEASQTRTAGRARGVGLLASHIGGVAARG